MELEDDDFTGRSWHDDDSDDESEWHDSDDDCDDSTETIECPKCGVDVYEDADHCPLCGEYFVPNHSVFSHRPAWFNMVALLGIIAVVLGLLLWSC